MAMHLVSLKKQEHPVTNASWHWAWETALTKGAGGCCPEVKRAGPGSPSTWMRRWTTCTLEHICNLINFVWVFLIRANTFIANL